MDHANDPHRVELCRAIPPEQAAALIVLLARQLARQADNGRIPAELGTAATVALMAGQDIESTLHRTKNLLKSDQCHHGPVMGTEPHVRDGVHQYNTQRDRARSTSALDSSSGLLAERQRLRAKRVDGLHKSMAKLQREYSKALDALRLVSGTNGERAALVIEALRQAGHCLLPSKTLVPLPPSAEDWNTWMALSHEDRRRHHVERSDLCRKCFDWTDTGYNGWGFRLELDQDVVRSEQRAVEHARVLLPALQGKLDDTALLAVLHEVSRPAAPSKNTERGKAAWKQLRDENGRRREAGLAPLRPITRLEEARTCAPVLARLGLRPDGADPDEAVRQAVDRGWEQREDHYGVSVRDRAAHRPSVK
ncbi:MAG TPA: hypothetical protein VJU61_25790 [Polyangiaceae bacterium]|nr:hypothetical protein [Polyangiaceae bacterium]